MEQDLLATWWSKGNKTCAEKVEMESDGEGCMEDKWCMETRLTSFNKVNYIKIYALRVSWLAS